MGPLKKSRTFYFSKEKNQLQVGNYKHFVLSKEAKEHVLLLPSINGHRSSPPPTSLLYYSLILSALGSRSHSRDQCPSLWECGSALQLAQPGRSTRWELTRGTGGETCLHLHGPAASPRDFDSTSACALQPGSSGDAPVREHVAFYQQRKLIKGHRDGGRGGRY